jgi:two-component system chemotaxis response regulator CheY
MGEKPLSVLVVDDSLLVRKQLKGILEEQGCAVMEAANGSQAFQIIKTSQPDLILMDIVMPEQDGIEALRKIKEVKPNTKVVMVSSVGTQSYLKEAVKLGAYDFLQKPINAEAIHRILVNLRKGECGA